DVEHGDFPGSHAPKEFLPFDGLHRAALLEVLPRDLIDLRKTSLRQSAQGDEEPADLVVGESVLDVQTLLLGVDEPSSPQHAQVLRRVGDGNRRLLGENLDGARALAEQVQQFEPFRRGQGLSETRELLVDRIFEAPMTRTHALKYSSIYLNKSRIR